MNRIERFHVESSDGVRIAVRTYGDPLRLPLVLSNGIGCTEVFWARFIEALSERHYLVEWSMRGHYDSSEAEREDAYRVQDHATDLEAVCAQLGLQRAVFVGFSLGVMVQLEHYRRFPERHLGMVHISGTPSDPFASLAGVPGGGQRLLSLMRFGHRHPELSRWVMRWGLQPRWAIAAGKLMGFIEGQCPTQSCASYLSRLSRFEPRPYLQTMLGMAAYDGRALLEQVKVPSLVVAGTNDNMAPVAVMRELYQRLPVAEWILVQGASHTILLSYGERIAGDVDDFLRRRAFDSARRS
ncbi:MAG: alpha/beta hydrolase [Myxococcota bacterium]|jgi:pimeloyl-ACP methyl ester carboxylesterase|nr:alpha/beta hydrolase [Myxococcota bacterium]